MVNEDYQDYRRVGSRKPALAVMGLMLAAFFVAVTLAVAEHTGLAEQAVQSFATLAYGSLN